MKFLKILLFFILAPAITLGQFFSVNAYKSISYPFFVGAKTDSIRVFKVGSDIELLGKKYLKNDSIFFEPLLGFLPKTNYFALCQGRKFVFFIPKQGISETPQLLQIYPKSDSLPSNVLKFYFVFSEPMSEGQAYEKIKLLDENNQEMPEAFVNLGVELWNENRTRLTLWIDPGRVKRHLLRNQNEGEVLETNKTYQIKVESGFRNKSGNETNIVFSKTFVTKSAIRKALNHKNWQLKVDKNKLKINFLELMDYATALKMIEVFDNKKSKIEGEWTIENDQIFSFKPSISLKKGQYLLKINTLIEDVAANNINAPFDRDIKKQKRNEREFVWKKFVLKSP